MASTNADEVRTHAVSPESILGGGAGAAAGAPAGGAPAGAGAVAAGGASAGAWAIAILPMTGGIAIAIRLNINNRYVITRCRKTCVMCLLLPLVSQKKGAKPSRLAR